MATELSNNVLSPGPLPKPTLFIGSSTERLPVANALKEILSDCAKVTVWNKAPELPLGEAVLQGLNKVGEIYDFALLVFGQDDTTMMRGIELPTVRDNVIFELGLFMGHMGTGRALWLSPRGPKAPKLSSDLQGIVHLQFDEPDIMDHSAIIESLAETRERIFQHINNVGFRTTKHIVPIRRALCLGSMEYAQAHFQEDIRYIHSFFSQDQVESKHGLTVDDFYGYFTKGQKWDMVHLALYVDRDKQRMWFDAGPDGGDNELSLQAIEGLIRDCEANLVVIITCDSLRFGQQLARFTNVVAGRRSIAPTDALRWAKVFYQALSSGAALSKAFNLAQDRADPGLVLLTHRDVRFRRLTGDSV